MLRLTPNQSEWFDKAERAKQKAFMSKGPAEVAMLFNFKTGKETFAPVIRGVRIGGAVESSDQALSSAQSYLEKLQSEDLPELDECALGITGECVRQSEICFEKNLRIEGILHIGSLLATDVFQRRWLDHLQEYFLSHLSDRESEELHPSVRPLKPEMTDDEEIPFNECLMEHLNDNNHMGYALLVSTPVMTYHSESSASFSWGYTQTHWVYAESVDAAFSLAEEWVDQMDKQFRQDSLTAA